MARYHVQMIILVGLVVTLYLMWYSSRGETNVKPELAVKSEDVKSSDEKPSEGVSKNDAGSSKQGEKNVISMSLYGNMNPRYTTGILRNAELVQKNFPGWTLRVYLEQVKGSPQFGKIPDDVIDKLKKSNVELVYVDPSAVGVAPMMWRFMVADDMSVDHFVIRDCDSRLTERDAATVKAWLESGKPFHCVRDHPSHANFPLSGGMWGGIPAKLHTILGKAWKDIMHGYGTQYLQDMTFLGRDIWPKVKDHAYCSDSVSCDRYSGSHPFPVKRIGLEHVGAVYDGNDNMRGGDVAILRRTPVNKKCVPP